MPPATAPAALVNQDPLMWRTKMAEAAREWAQYARAVLAWKQHEAARRREVARLMAYPRPADESPETGGLARMTRALNRDRRIKAQMAMNH